MENTEKTTKWLSTAEVAEYLGLHRNTLATYKNELQPMKAKNGKENLYDSEKVYAFFEERKRKNPKIIS